MRGDRGDEMTRRGAVARIAGLLLALTVVQATAGAAAGAEAVPAEARAQLAPTGKLRAALVLYDPALASRDAAGEPIGVAPDLARALAERLGVPLQPILFDSPAAYAASIGFLRWDIGLAGREAGGPGRVDLSAAFMLIDQVLLLGPGKTFQDFADIDREKVRVGVTIGTASDQLLTRKLTNALIFRVLVGVDNASRTLRNSGADVLAGSAPFLARVGAEVPGSRILGPPFAVVPAVIAVSPGRTEGLAYVNEFVREAKASGFLQRSIERAGLQGVRVAPP
jgi:polar amino acid transport system substrate-binding protein